MAHYLAALLTCLRSVSEEEVAAIRRDDDALRRFFAAYAKADKVWSSAGSLSVCSMHCCVPLCAASLPMRVPC